MAFKFDDSYFEKLGRSPEVVAMVTAKAEEIARLARASAPVDSGDYKKSIGVRVKFQKRAVALVEAADRKSMIIESRTGNLVRALNKAKRRRG